MHTRVDHHHPFMRRRKRKKQAMNGWWWCSFFPPSRPPCAYVWSKFFLLLLLLLLLRLVSASIIYTFTSTVEGNETYMKKRTIKRHTYFHASTNAERQKNKMKRKITLALPLLSRSHTHTRTQADRQFRDETSSLNLLRSVPTRSNISSWIQSEDKEKKDERGKKFFWQVHVKIHIRTSFVQWFLLRALCNSDIELNTKENITHFYSRLQPFVSHRIDRSNRSAEQIEKKIQLD